MVIITARIYVIYNKKKLDVFKPPAGGFLVQQKEDQE